MSLAVAWLKNNETEQAISISAVIAEAKAKPLAGHGGDRKSGIGDAIEQAKAKPLSQHGDKHLDQGCNTTLKPRGTVEYTLRRLARDCPEMLDKIEAGEMSVNQAAIAAGIRRKPTSAEVCVRVFRKVDD